MRSAPRAALSAACISAALLSGTTASAQLLNAGFETAGTGTVFANWIDFNNAIGNISRAAEAVRTGAFSAKMFGTFAGDFNVSGFFQDLPTTVDQVWDAQAYFQHLSTDAIGVGNRVAMNVEFRASNGDLLEFWTVDALTSTSPTNQWIQQAFAATAPDDAVIARMTLLFIQPDIEAGAGHIDDVSLSSSGSSTLLINPGFEDFGGFGSASACRGWSQVPRFASNIFQNSDMPRTGTFAGFLFGQFTGSPNFSFFSQTFPASAGQTVDASVWALHKSTDAIAAGNFGFINLEFLDASGAIIGDILTNPGINSMSPTNVYAELPVSGAAPANTARVRVVIGYFQAALGGGGVHFDDVSVAISSAPEPCPGDADGNGVVDFDDITSVLSNWLVDYTPGTGPGDADASGIVDFDDITSILSNWLDACP
ncbi:MAG TPA: hypothetical protein DEB06_06050 [Phycisphaerales bacterium]|nr:hypothetical protein [Phycisphaerales bacterium]